ncbi:MAG TPA: M17 family metallopeptidase [Gammaproteobacteria bacterium]|nr:M17 family metallopeptidase [Gammaproteobacteria bacterium]
MDLPEFTPLRITQSTQRITRGSLDAFDHVIVVVPKHPPPRWAQKLPRGRQLEQLLAKTSRRGDDFASTRADNARSTGITIAAFEATSPFAALTWARKAVAEAQRDKPATLGIVPLGFDDGRSASGLAALVAAAHAAAFELPTFRTTPARGGSRLRALKVLGAPEPLDLAAAAAHALGNNTARWFTALPPNVLTATTYRDALAKLAKSHSLLFEFLDEAALKKLGAGAFLAVAQGNGARDAGIAHLGYRPSRGAPPGVALVGKGILMDTGGTNLKPFKGMLDMHYDMQGSAVALGALLALAQLRAPYSVDAWLAITENRIGPSSYKSQDLVYAANGTSIQVIHTDAEGRMVLADTLALAARAHPRVIVDYASLTAACMYALTQRYSGVFSNRAAANGVLTDAGVASGERVWPFPMDEDFDELLKSDVADVKQCTVENEGDHILAARFLNRFVPADVPWIHVDLSAGQHKGGLAHVPTEVTGFGARLTIELLRGEDASLGELTRRLSS